MSELFAVLFFFSSRRRHTRWPRDWSSDVCSSDLADHVSVDGGDLHRVTAAAGAVTAPGGHLLGGRTADRPAHHLRPAQVALRPPPEGDQCPPSMTVGALARSGTGPCSGPRSWRSSSGWSSTVC